MSLGRSSNCSAKPLLPTIWNNGTSFYANFPENDEYAIVADEPTLIVHQSRLQVVEAANCEAATLPAIAPVLAPTPEPTSSANLPACVNSDCNCDDFSSWQQAQDVLQAYPGDPHGLDRDNDGIACESLQ